MILSLRRTAILLAAAMLGLAAPAYAQDDGPTAVVTISTLRWYALQQTDEGDGERVYQAFANVRRLPADRVRFYALSFASRLSRALVIEFEVDCAANTTWMLGGGGAAGDRGEIYPIGDSSPQSTDEGTHGRAVIRTVCATSGWREVADPMREGMAFIGRFQGVVR